MSEGICEDTQRVAPGSGDTNIQQHEKDVQSTGVPAPHPGAPSTPSPTPPAATEASTARTTPVEQHRPPHGLITPQAARELALQLVNHGVTAWSEAVRVVAPYILGATHWLLQQLQNNKWLLTGMPESMMLALRTLVKRVFQLQVVQQLIAIAKQLAYVRITMSKDDEAAEKVKFSGQLVTTLSALFGMVRVRNYSSVVLAAPTLSPAPQPELSPYSPVAGRCRGASPNHLQASSDEVHLLCSTELKQAILSFLRQQTQVHGQSFVLLGGSSRASMQQGAVQQGAGAATAAAATPAEDGTEPSAPPAPTWARHLVAQGSLGDSSKACARSFFSQEPPPSLAASAAAAAAAVAATASAINSSGSTSYGGGAAGCASPGSLQQLVSARRSLEVGLPAAAAAALGTHNSSSSSSAPGRPVLSIPAGFAEGGVRSPQGLQPPVSLASPVLTPQIPVSPAGLSQLLEGMCPAGRVSPIGFPARHGISIRRRSGAGSGAGAASAGGAPALTASLPEPLRGLLPNMHAARSSTSTLLTTSSSSSSSRPQATAAAGAFTGQGGSGMSTPVLLKGGESPPSS